jgi:nitroimidazol reductase NimA-like FMN-containing flavoprotein (pyridoxamine 5'-phosphate oxidase superfamily)
VKPEMIKLPSMSEREIDELIENQFLCRVAFKGNDGPHIAPFQYVIYNFKLYFHFTNYGSKMDFLKEGSPVCVEIEQFSSNMSEYSFVTLQGTLKKVEDKEEKQKVIQEFSEYGQKNLSTNFLAAHGLPSEKGWPNLTPDKRLVIIRLDNITSKKGLKSPE